MQKKKIRKSIVSVTAFRVSSVFIFALLLLTISFSAYISRYMRKNILEEKEKQTKTIAETINSQIDSFTTPLISISSYEPAIRLLNQYDAMYSKEWMKNIRNMDNYLQNVNLFENEVIDILLIRPDGKVAYSMSDRMDFTYDYLGQAWFEDALEGDFFIHYAYHEQSNFYYKEQKSDTLSAIYPVLLSEGKTGYVLFEYDLAQVAAYFRTTEEEDLGYLLLDNAGHHLFEEGEREKDVEIQFQKTLEQAKKNKNDFIYGDCFYTFCELPSCGWTVLSEMKLSTMYAPIVHLIWIIGFIILVVIVLLAMISAYSTRRIKAPYEALIEQIISFDGSSAVVPYDYQDAPKELYTIGTKFQEMSDKMNTLIQDVYLAELSRKEMELEAMSNQIHPHFLYNVFQLIQTEAVLADNQNIEDMIQKLSSMMRYTMERKQTKVSVAEEVEYAENYLMFYKERFENRFTYDIDCEADIRTCRTIKFILQPVIENCFKHGFKNVSSGGKILVTGKAEGEYIVFRIWDNGCGMTAERLLEVRESLSGTISAKGIGIANTNARLRLIYDSSCGISFESQEGSYTEAVIRIKRERE